MKLILYPQIIWVILMIVCGAITASEPLTHISEYDDVIALRLAPSDLVNVQKTLYQFGYKLQNITDDGEHVFVKEFEGWAISEGLFNKIREILPEGSTILELGSGAGTKELLPYYTVYSIEHNPEWINVYDTNYIYAPIVNDWYDTEILKRELPKEYDLILVDGPPGFIGRGQFLDNLDLFNTAAIIVIDDVNRIPEYDLMVRVANKLGRSYVISIPQKKGKLFGIIY